MSVARHCVFTGIFAPKHTCAATDIALVKPAENAHKGLATEIALIMKLSNAAGFCTLLMSASSTDVLNAMKDMFRDVLQEALEAEMDEELGYSKNDIAGNNSGNSRNGSYKKTLKSELGEVELDIPCDRNGEYEPQIIPKHKRNVTGIEEKVLALYAAGMTTRDIYAQIQDLYDIEISAEMVSKITDKILPMMQ